jgi:catechol-2,3-dioxygenase
MRWWWSWAQRRGRRTPLTNDLICIESIADAVGPLHAGAMQLIRIDHVSLDVHDRPASIAWYEEVLGLGAHARHDVPDQPVFLGPAGARLGLFADRPPGLRHVALATDRAEQHRLAARLDRLGIAYQPERHRESHSIYLADPDGTMLEVMAPRP